MTEKYEMVIGLEVHAQMLTLSKAYSSDSTEYGNLPNTNVSAITMGLPGTLPKINKKVVEYAIKMGLATNCQITRYNIYARKNYFYPDLPKGYQITQDKTPICTEGYLEIKTKDGKEKKIRIQRIHMEEDAGKSIHIPEEVDTLVDFNRAGVPLIEIVTHPDIKDGEEAYAYLTEIRKIVRYLEICDGNMEEGSLRADVNISVMLKGSKTFGTKVEVKNMNSFRNVQRAIQFEFERQTRIIEEGGTVISETRNFDATTGQTYGMRLKEVLNDYRYFPEPDLQPLIVEQSWIDKVKSEMTALPSELFKKFVNQYGLSEYDAWQLTDNKEIALYFESITLHTSNYKAAANWVMGTIKSYLNELTLHINQFELKPHQIAELIALVDSGKVSNTVATQTLFSELIKNNSKNAEELAKELNLIQVSDTNAIQPIIEEVMNRFPDKIVEYKSGKVGLLGLFVGEVMKASKGKADPKLTNQLVKEFLEK
jgi:aspartyl-tRNA(Asn)/glutamyl-tRNA(Gln) amidotransferase subunit B